MKMNDHLAPTKRTLAAVRVLMYALVLAALGLVVACTSVNPAAATAQDEPPAAPDAPLTEPAGASEVTVHAEPTAASDAVPSDPTATPDAVPAGPPRAPHQVPATTPAQTPADIHLQPGETAALDGDALRVTLVGVVEDSRCPRGVMCVWMGRAVVALHVVLDGVDLGDHTLTLDPRANDQTSAAQAAIVDRYLFSLIDLQPYPTADQPQPSGQRIATIRVTTVTP